MSTHTWQISVGAMMGWHKPACIYRR